MSQTKDLTMILHRAWQLIEQSPNDKTAPLRTPVLGTRGDDYNIRMVVLREASSKHRYLRCHTHIQSAKIAHIKKHPTANWLFYEPTLRIQIRARGPTRLEVEGILVNRLWQQAHPSMQLAYLDPHPGKSHTKEKLSHMDPRKNFVAIETLVEHMDILEISDTSLVRSTFHWDGTCFNGQWVTP